MAQIQAEFRVPTEDVKNDLPFYTEQLGFRLETIYPADDPEVAVLSGHGVRLRIEKGATELPGTLRILTDNPDALAAGERVVTAPNGTRIEIAQLNPPMIIPEVEHTFAVRRLTGEDPWVVGRAGMHYRDLIPDRLGGSIIASHIKIPEGGPVPDMVHYHTVGFQLIFCYKGWVELVYEDQGEPFKLHAGNCVIQPPEIRHRVLSASDNIEVIEIGVPASHMTTIDHDMELPNATYNPDRLFKGQRFVHHEADKAGWTPFRMPGFMSRDTTISANTQGLAGVHVIRKGKGKRVWSSHDSEIHFSFVMSGRMILEGEGVEPCFLSAGGAFVIPPKMRTRYSDPSDDLELLEVSLPGEFETSLH